MTPRERWDAAVALQHETVAQIAKLPLDAAGDRRCVDLVNRAGYDLMMGYLALPDPRPLASEFQDAYNLHREALFRRERAATLYRALGTLEDRRLAMARVWSAIPPHMKTDSADARGR